MTRLSQVALRVEVAAFAPLEQIFKRGEAADRLLIIQNGVCTTRGVILRSGSCMGQGKCGADARVVHALMGRYDLAQRETTLALLRAYIRRLLCAVESTCVRACCASTSTSQLTVSLTALARARARKGCFPGHS